MLKLLLGIVAMVIGAVLVRAWVLTELWAWFLVPTFSIVQISMPVAMGISLIVAMFTQHLQHERAETSPNSVSEVFGRVFGTAILSPLVVWALGWIIQLFI